MLKVSKLLITVLMLSALVFAGCSCGKKKSDKETTTNKNQGVAATIINEDGSVEYVADIINDSDGKTDGEDDINDLVNGGDDNKKSGSKKSSSSKSSSKKSSTKSNSKKSSGSNASNDVKKSDSKKNDSKKDDKKSDDKEKTTKKSNFDVQKDDDDNRFGPIINGKKK